VNRLNKVKRKKIDQDAKKETRAIVMVWTNSLVNFLLRLSEIFLFVSSSSSLFPGNVLFRMLRSIVNLENLMMSVAYFTYVLTFVTNVIVYCLFNPKFKLVYVPWPSFVKKK
jgi:hypothetical protein